MSLTGTSKSPTIQSLAMRLLTMPGSRLPGDSGSPTTEAPDSAPTPAPAAASPAQPSASTTEEVKPKVHRARKTMSKPSSVQVPEKRVSEMLHFRVSDDLRSILEPEEPAKHRKYDYMADALHKRIPLSLQRSSPRATTEITVTEEMTAPATASQDDGGQEWETEVGDDFSLFYDSYSVDGHMDSDSK
ncbi:PREDICTED: histone-lysine N-methyltransferase EHMT2-like, partial [Thamnophis sirtalis]|uniref:Histone-lysine N-methyltransferase EHMT2-like n=2 Tax=Thamnophis TaxID=34999 RepID=A0A6I9YSC3_9SAUR